MAADEWPKAEMYKACQRMSTADLTFDAYLTSTDEAYGHFFDSDESDGASEEVWLVQRSPTNITAARLLQHKSLGERWLEALDGNASSAAGVEHCCAKTLNDEAFDWRSSNFRRVARQVNEMYCDMTGSSFLGSERALTRALSRALVFDKLRTGVSALEHATRLPDDVPGPIASFTLDTLGTKQRKPRHRDDSPIALLALDREHMLVPLIAYAADVLGVDIGHVPDLYASGYGLTHAAAAYGPPHVLLWLLEARQLDPDVRTARNAASVTAGATPLHLAASRARLDCVTILLKSGAGVNRLNSPNLSYFQRHADTINAAAGHGNKSPLELYETLRPTTPLNFSLNAITDADSCQTAIDILDALIKYGADLHFVYHFVTPKGIIAGTVFNEADITFELNPTLTNNRVALYLTSKKNIAMQQLRTRCINTLPAAERCADKPRPARCTKFRRQHSPPGTTLSKSANLPDSLAQCA